MQSLINELEDVERELYRLENYSKNLHIDYMKEVNEQLDALYIRKKRLESRINNYDKDAVISDGEIDLVLRKEDEDSYYIQIADTDTYIGIIEYHEDNSKSGNISCSIDENHRGRNYATKAFKLLNKILNEKGIEQLAIAVSEKNIAAIKTLENVGGKCIGSFITGTLIYEVNTSYEKEKER